MADRKIRKKLAAIYRALFKAYGPQHWWPGETRLEIIIGALLTQNTSWTNVERAIENLKKRGVLNYSGLKTLPLAELASLIRPSGYFNIKARRVKNLLDFIDRHYHGSLRKMLSADPLDLRPKLLAVNGIGPETADSILLYAAAVPLFVVDSYTRRVLTRHGMIPGDADYQAVQDLFMNNLEPDAELFNEYHALLVKVGKEHCRKSDGVCSKCPLRNC